MKALAVIVAVAVLGFYGAAGLFGWELSAAERSTLPPSARNSPGGHGSAGGISSYHFWHSGFHGGK
jgi:hypothetical protein